MANFKTHYDTLKLSRHSPPKLIDAVYQALSEVYRLEHHGAPHTNKALQQLKQAYAVLSDPEQRKIHDSWIERVEADIHYDHETSVKTHLRQKSGVEKGKIQIARHQLSVMQAEVKNLMNTEQAMIQADNAEKEEAADQAKKARREAAQKKQYMQSMFALVALLILILIGIAVVVDLKNN